MGKMLQKWLVSSSHTNLSYGNRSKIVGIITYQHYYYYENFKQSKMNTVQEKDQDIEMISQKNHPYRKYLRNLNLKNVSKWVNPFWNIKKGYWGKVVHRSEKRYSTQAYGNSSLKIEIYL